MKLLIVAVIVVISILCPSNAFHANSFDAIKGCKQYGNVANYDDPLTYIPTKDLLHVENTSKSKLIKIAVQGSSDGILRFGASLYPYNRDVIEIVLGGWTNTQSAGRRQHRSASNNNTNLVLAEVQTPQLLSANRPTVFLVELFHDGTIQVRIEGQDYPFLLFNDAKKTPFNYMAFTKWNNDVVYFYDCPVNTNATICYEGGKMQVN
ncbi:AGAP006195-PA [Anopheles gambiae str. PEST]|uniref:AGAP006195-PA n=1 Tax=Anopheles gambiae TaxID=7165 RepID=Q7Q5V0_ANOGA|nr:AGAP006195-PA [Anopheles gambiae str. PEST]